MDSKRTSAISLVLSSTGFAETVTSSVADVVADAAVVVATAPATGQAAEGNVND